MKRTVLTLAFVAMVAPAWAQNMEPGAHFIENWDVDGNGSITLADITSRRDDVFFMFDTDENDSLNAEEYALFDETRELDRQTNAEHGNGKGMRRAAQGMTLAFNDSDGNGEVSRDEFLANASNWLAMLDRNSDNTVTTADFGRQ